MTHTGNQHMNTSTIRRAAWGARGFTLVELLITVAIVSILAAIAYPSYQNYVVRTHRNAAKACLSQYSQFMERLYTTELAYNIGAAPLLPCRNEGSLDTRYTIAVPIRTATAYTATATPIGVQSTRDTRCSTLSLDSAGTRVAGSGSAADVAYCW